MQRHPVTSSLIQVRVGLILAAAFLVAMGAFFIFHDPYSDVGDDIAVGGSFDQSPFAEGGAKPNGRWHARGESVQWEPRGGYDSSGGVRLGVGGDLGNSLLFTIDDPKRFTFLRFAGRLRTERIVVGEEPWNSARLLLFFTDRNGRRHYHEACEVSGTRTWQDCEGVIAVPDFAVTAHILAQNTAASGTLWIDNVRVTPAVEKPSTFFWRLLFAIMWCGVLAYCVWLARLPRKVLSLAAIAVALAIIVGVAAPESAVERLLNRGVHAAKSLVKGYLLSPGSALGGQTAGSPKAANPGEPAFLPPRPLRHDTVNAVKKVGHFVLFGLLAFVAFSWAARVRRTPSVPASSTTDFATLAAALLVFAAGTEVLQFLTTTRQPSLFDWGIDAAGILVGAAVALFARRMALRPVSASNPLA